MLLGQTKRFYSAFTVTFPSGSPTSNAFALAAGGFALGIVTLPSGFTGFGLAAQVGTAGGTPAAIKDAYDLYGGPDVNVILPTAQLAAPDARPMPALWFAAGQVVLWSHNGTGSGMPQTSARVVGIQVVS